MSSTSVSIGPTRRDRLARLAVATVFALHGIAAGSWAARIPWVKETRHLSSAGLGLALMGAAIGGLSGMPIAAWLSARVDSRTLTRAMVIAVAVTLPLPAFAPGMPSIFGSLLLFGAAGGVLDVAMNAQGVTVQERYGRSIMSGLHGLWSIGGLIGSATAGLVARAGIAAPGHLLTVGVVIAVVGTLCGTWLTPAPPSAAGKVFARPDRALLVLGVITFCSLFGEAAAADWSAVYLRTTAHATSDVAAWGYAGFSLSMAAARLAGDRVVGRFGAPRVVRAAAVIGAVGLAVGLLVPVTPVVIVAFVLLGLGMATVVPLTFSAAGRTPGRDPGTAVAAVGTVGYGGWMIAPPVIGFVAQATSLTTALALVAVMTALIALPAGALRER
ncbi:MFS transporter [Actinoallomurus purpureus]|uniref:MFS transporter n=1 Tax=Actinoallomurus purpureus TaxID=478114 RepID=UPI0020929944|nr:MFS transporter [Actinoallomurus purpureus]MCO6005589.1 MFS transporter [Actinoallomurus purpureus]